MKRMNVEIFVCVCVEVEANGVPWQAVETEVGVKACGSRKIITNVLALGPDGPYTTGMIVMGEDNAVRDVEKEECVGRGEGK